MTLAAHPTGLQLTAGVVAAVLALVLLVLLVAMAVRWRTVRHADSRPDAVRLALGARGARAFLAAVGVLAVALLVLGVAMHGGR